MLTLGLLSLLTLVALLAIPITLTFSVSWQQTLHSDMQLRGLFGLLRIRIARVGTHAPPLRDDQIVTKAARLRSTVVKRSPHLQVMSSKPVRQRLFKFVRDCGRIVEKRDVTVNLRIGLDDPADTGRLWAILGPVAGVLASVRAASIQIQPEFAAPCWHLDSSGQLRLVPVQIIFLVLGLALSPTLWRAIKQTRGAR